jgi:hypothetical protein
LIEALEPWFEVLRKLYDTRLRPPQLTAAQHESWELRTRMILSQWFLNTELVASTFPFLKVEHFADNTERIVHLLEHTDAGRMDPADAAILGGAGDKMKRLFAGEFLAHDREYLKDWRKGMASALREGQDVIIQQHINSFVYHSPLLRLSEWSWDLLDRAFDVCVCDPMKSTGTMQGEFASNALGLWPALRGDISRGNQLLDDYIQTSKAIASGKMNIPVFPEGETQENFRTLMGPIDVAGHYMSLALHILGRDQDAADLLANYGFSWTTADSVVDELAQSDGVVSLMEMLQLAPRARGSTETSVRTTVTAEDLSWSIKLQHVLVTASPASPSAADVLAALPSPEVLDSYVGDINPGAPGAYTRTRSSFVSLTLLAALVVEKLGKLDDALLYVAKALRTEPRESFVKARAVAVEAAAVEITVRSQDNQPVSFQRSEVRILLKQSQDCHRKRV